MAATGRLFYADSERDADLYYLTRFLAGDPFLFLETDARKTLFLSDEVTDLRRQLGGVFFGVQNGECELLDEIQLDLVGRYGRMQEEVTAFVSRDEYALDTDVRLILDPPLLDGARSLHAPSDGGQHETWC